MYLYHRYEFCDTNNHPSEKTKMCVALFQTLTLRHAGSAPRSPRFRELLCERLSEYASDRDPQNMITLERINV